MFIRVDQYVDVGDKQIDEKALDEFIDAYLEMVVSLGYQSGGAFKLMTQEEAEQPELPLTQEGE